MVAFCQSCRRAFAMVNAPSCPTCGTGFADEPSDEPPANTGWFGGGVGPGPVIPDHQTPPPDEANEPRATQPMVSPMASSTAGPGLVIGGGQHVKAEGASSAASSPTVRPYQRNSIANGPGQAPDPSTDGPPTNRTAPGLGASNGASAPARQRSVKSTVPLPGIATADADDITAKDEQRPSMPPRDAPMPTLRNKLGLKDDELPTEVDGKVLSSDVLDPSAATLPDGDKPMAMSTSVPTPQPASATVRALSVPMPPRAGPPAAAPPRRKTPPLGVEALNSPSSEFLASLTAEPNDPTALAGGRTTPMPAPSTIPVTPLAASPTPAPPSAGPHTPAPATPSTPVPQAGGPRTARLTANTAAQIGSTLPAPAFHQGTEKVPHNGRARVAATPQPMRIAIGLLLAVFGLFLVLAYLPEHEPLTETEAAAMAAESGSSVEAIMSARLSTVIYVFGLVVAFFAIVFGGALSVMGLVFRPVVEVVCRACKRKVFAERAAVGARCPACMKYAKINWVAVVITGGFWTAVVAVIVVLAALALG